MIQWKDCGHTVPWAGHTQAGSCCSGSPGQVRAERPSSASQQADPDTHPMTAAPQEAQAAAP